MRIFVLVIHLLIISSNAWASDENELIQTLAPELLSKSKADRIAAIDGIAASSAPRKDLWLEAMIEGNLYQVKKTDDMVVASREGKLYKLESAIDGSDLGVEKKRALRKVKIDNSMRSYLRSVISLFALTSDSTDERLAAVDSLIGKADSDVTKRIRKLLEEEPDQRVTDSMRLLVSIHDLENGTDEQRTEALSFVDGRVDNQVVNALRDLSQNSPDDFVVSQATELLAKAETKISRYKHVETLFFGLSLGSVLVIAAIGLAITFGVMGVINMAHGELIMLGAYTTYFIQQLFPAYINYSLIFAIPAAFVVSGLVGILIERTVIRHLYGRALETLLATFGISLILQQAVRTFVSPQNVAVINPSWMTGSWLVNPALSLTLNRLIIIGFCLFVFAVLLLIFTRTGFGLQMRAVVQNRQMARAMGIRSARVDALTFGLGSGVAGIAGVALSQLGNVGPNLGQTYIIDSFIVVVMGGVGNLWGTLVAGITLGIGNKVLEPWAGAVLAKIILLVFIILFIQKRPGGLFPQRGRAVEN